MEKNRSVATLQLLGGHHSLDFANTVAARGDRQGPDALADYGDLLAWAERANLIDPPALAGLRRSVAAASPAGTAALARAKRLREALYEVFSALAAGQAAPAAGLGLLREEYLDARRSQRLAVGPGGGRWEWPLPGPDAVTHRVAVKAVELLTGPEAGRVKECPGPNCGWLFLDLSRNRSRRWCSDADCGTRHRVAQHRMRARSRAQRGA